LKSTAAFTGGSDTEKSNRVCPAQRIRPTRTETRSNGDSVSPVMTGVVFLTYTFHVIAKNHTRNNLVTQKSQDFIILRIVQATSILPTINALIRHSHLKTTVHRSEMTIHISGIFHRARELFLHISHHVYWFRFTMTQPGFPEK